MSAPARSRNSRLLWCVGIAATAGIGVFAFFAWHGVTVERVQPSEVSARFAEIRTRLSCTEPIWQADAAGVLTRREPPGEPETRPTRLRVLGYRAPQERLVRVDVPFWFLKVKGPGVQYTLSEAGLDLERLGITPGDLEKYGPCLVLDQTRANGDRLLVWTE
jgi:hypothetical protein